MVNKTDIHIPMAEQLGITVEEQRREASKDQPIQCIGVPRDVANVVLFYASGNPDFMTSSIMQSGGSGNES